MKGRVIFLIGALTYFWKRLHNSYPIKRNMDAERKLNVYHKKTIHRKQTLPSAKWVGRGWASFLKCVSSSSVNLDLTFGGQSLTGGLKSGTTSGSKSASTGNGVDHHQSMNRGPNPSNNLFTSLSKSVPVIDSAQSFRPSILLSGLEWSSVSSKTGMLQATPVFGEDNSALLDNFSEIGDDSNDSSLSERCEAWIYLEVSWSLFPLRTTRVSFLLQTTKPPVLICLI